MTHYKELLCGPGGERQHITMSVAGCGRLKAASDPTGHEQGEDQNPVAWLRKVQYFSMKAGAGSATAEALYDMCLQLGLRGPCQQEWSCVD